MADSDHSSPATSLLLQHAEVHEPPMRTLSPAPCSPQLPATLAVSGDVPQDVNDDDAIVKPEEPMVTAKPVAATPLVGFHEHLTCHLCKSLVNNPIMLPCLCRVCKNCLENHCHNVAASTSIQHAHDHDVQGARAQARDESLVQDGKRQSESDIEDSVVLTDIDFDTSVEEHDVYGLENFTDQEHNSRASSVLSDVHRKPESIGTGGTRYMRVRCPFGCANSTGIEVNLDNNSITGMPPVNRYLDHLKWEYDLEERLAAGQQQCTNCIRGNIAIAVCKQQDCPNNPLCMECLASHITTVRTREHVIVHVSELRKEEDKVTNGDKVPLPRGPKYKVLKGVQMKPWFCDFHKDEIVKYYCEEHEEVFCSGCAIAAMQRVDNSHSLFHRINDHHNCIKYDVNNKYESEWNTPDGHPLLKKLTEAQDILSEFEAAEQNMKTMKKSLKSRYKQVCEDIESHCNEIIEQVKLEKELLLRKAARICKRKNQRLKDHIAVVQRMQKPFRRSIPFIEDFIYTSAAVPVQYYFLKKQIIDHLEFLCSEYKNHLKKPQEDATIVFDPNNITIHNNIGKVYSTPCVKEFQVVNLPNELYAFNPYCFTVNARDILQTRVCGALPRLSVVIRPNHEAREQEMRGLVRRNTGEGIYTVTLFPPAPGEYKVYLYKHLPAPLNWELVQGQPMDITVVTGGLVMPTSNVLFM